jgi:hypothetical protein
MGRSNEKAVTWSDCEGPSNAQGAKLPDLAVSSSLLAIADEVTE